jgi:predicted ribosomally synthesized peptide with SipW-like signal peptide
MNRVLPRLTLFATWRVLLAMAVAVGVLGSQGGGGTLAYFTASVSNGGNTFTAGKIVLDNATIGSGVATPLLTFTSGALPASTVCENNDQSVAGAYVAAVGNASGTRPMVPGDKCAAKLTISSGSTTLDIYYNIALQANAFGAAGTLNARLNDALYLEIGQSASCSPTTSLTGSTGYISKFIGGSADGTHFGLVQSATTYVEGDATMTASGSTNTTVNAGSTQDWCVQVSLPRGTGTSGGISPLNAAYNNTGASDVTTVQGGTTTYTFVVNARQKANATNP